MNASAKGGGFSDPICLVDDDSSDDHESSPSRRSCNPVLSETDGESMTLLNSESTRGRGRDLPEGNDVPTSAKRARHDEGGSPLSADARIQQQTVPIKLFASLHDGERNVPSNHRRRRRDHRCTLREMLGLDTPESAHVTIDWIVICNYLIDFGYLLDQVPELLSCPQAIVFYGHESGSSTSDAWKQACTRENGSTSVHFVRLVPSDPRLSPTNPLPYQIPYGVHHSKMFLIGFSNGILRVAIHTANLRFTDIHLKAQGAYIQDFPLKTAVLSCEFEEDLVGYVESYRYKTPHLWNQAKSNCMDETKRTLPQELRRYDFSSAKVVLVPSIPGRHKLEGAVLLGHLKLRKAIRDHTTPGNASVHADRTIVCQFSSMGSLTEKWLQEFASSADSRHSSSSPSKLVGKLKLVYPTAEEVRSSIEGYLGGNSVPGTRRNVQKPFLQPLYCKWSSGDGSNPWCKARNVPHIKTYFQLSLDQSSMEWFVLSSHNMSRAAWGEIQHGQFGRVLFIRHWELGVFLSPKVVYGDDSDNRLVPLRSGPLQEHEVGIPLPYNLNPEPYGRADLPWAVDAKYAASDSFGRFSAQD